MTQLLNEPTTKKTENNQNLKDGVELALKFFQALEDSEQASQKRHNMRYLGMCIRSLQHNLKNIGSNST